MGHLAPEDNSFLKIRAPRRAVTPLPLEPPRRKAHRTQLSRSPFHGATSPKTSDSASPAPASPRLTTPDDQPEGQPARLREEFPEHTEHDLPSVGVRPLLDFEVFLPSGNRHPQPKLEGRASYDRFPSLKHSPVKLKAGETQHPPSRTCDPAHDRSGAQNRPGRNRQNPKDHPQHRHRRSDASTREIRTPIT